MYNLSNCMLLESRYATCTLCTSLLKLDVHVDIVILCRPWWLMLDDGVKLLFQMLTDRPIMNFSTIPVFSFGELKQPTQLGTNIMLSAELNLFCLNVTTTSLITSLSSKRAAGVRV